MVTYEDFQRLDIRCGTILSARPFPAARKPAYQLEIDFGPELGRRRSSAQITDHYEPSDLEGRQVLAVINFPERQIANFFSECLVLGLYDHDHSVILIRPDMPVANGARLG